MVHVIAYTVPLSRMVGVFLPTSIASPPFPLALLPPPSPPSSDDSLSDSACDEYTLDTMYTVYTHPHVHMYTCGHIDKQDTFFDYHMMSVD